MFTKIISGLSFVVAALGLAVFSAPAAACTDVANQWDCVHGTVPAQYSGSGTISHWYTGTLACDNAQAIVDLSVSSGNMTVSISSFGVGSSSNASCTSLGFSNFNWTGTLSGGANSDTIYTPSVEYGGTTVCSGSTGVTFTDDGLGGSYIELGPTMSGWAGTCTFDFTLSNSSVSAH